MYRVIALALVVSVPAVGFAADLQKPVKAKAALHAEEHPRALGKHPTTIQTIKVGGTTVATGGTSPFLGIQPKSEEDRSRFMDYADIRAGGGHVQAF